MKFVPHPDQELNQTIIKCAIVTVSDTRTTDTDKSGQIIQELLIQNNHIVNFYTIVKDEPEQIKEQLVKINSEYQEIQVIIFNGGTGIAPRDTTYDVLEGLLEKTLPGFGELFRFLSYQEIGSRAMASRSIAGIYQNKLIFSLPGSSNAVKLALEKLILPELNHLGSLIS
jgi:molybdenum cofactor biosynthesis protein B